MPTSLLTCHADKGTQQHSVHGHRFAAQSIMEKKDNMESGTGATLVTEPVPSAENYPGQNQQIPPARDNRSFMDDVKQFGRDAAETAKGK